LNEICSHSPTARLQSGRLNDRFRRNHAEALTTLPATRLDRLRRSSHRWPLGSKASRPELAFGDLAPFSAERQSADCSRRCNRLGATSLLRRARS
jgi:hypothetical protein